MSLPGPAAGLATVFSFPAHPTGLSCSSAAGKAALSSQSKCSAGILPAAWPGSGCGSGAAWNWPMANTEIISAQTF